MNSATVLYPHQLYSLKSASHDKTRTVYLVEESLFLTEFGTHRQKLLLHRLSLQVYKEELEAASFVVVYLDVHDYPTTESVFAKLHADGITEIHTPDTTDDWLEQRISKFAPQYNITRVWYPSELFILKEGYRERYLQSKKHMAAFYKRMRLDFDILLESDQTPVGGEWSFDSENRKKLPTSIPLPSDITFFNNADTETALTWLATLPGEHYGEAAVWIPYTRTAALQYLITFLEDRLELFGPYEDAIHTSHCRLFHSAISPLLNIGLLDPETVLRTTITYATTHNVPTASLEGFVRQILGWREFIRAAYEVDGRQMRSTNFFAHTRHLATEIWTGTTGIPPLDTAVRGALRFGYTHHIERLMVLGNFMLLTKTDPDDVYRWFMAMYVDAYDWVMVPNVYGMSQFADGGLFATKPYISGGNYIKKMSSYGSGEWEELWTALYWNFIADHQSFFLKNHRLSMMPRLLIKMTEEKRKGYLKRAADYLSKNT